MIALTIDIEDWYHVPTVTGSPFSKYKDTNEFFRKWKARYDYLTKPTKRVLDLLDEFNLKATFFVVAEIIEHYPGLVKQISDKGHEIACHGLHHSCKINPKTKKPLITRTEFTEQTLEAKKKLEEASSQEIIGYRAPNAYIAGWMIDILEDIGFRYDSSVSVNSLYNKSDSHLNRVDSRPYYPQIGNLSPGMKRGILELPWSYLKFGLILPAAGGPMLRFFGTRFIIQALKQSLKRGHTVFYFHPIDISEERFPNNFSGKRPFYWLNKGRVTEKRIIKILRYFNSEFTSCRDIVEEYFRR